MFPGLDTKLRKRKVKNVQYSLTLPELKDAFKPFSEVIIKINSTSRVISLQTYNPTLKHFIPRYLKLTALLCWKYQFPFDH